MPEFLQPSSLAFPAPEHSDEHGIIALGGDLSAERLLAAYKNGIFPWPHEDYDLLWFCPDPRFVLIPQEFRLSRSLRKTLRSCDLLIKIDNDFLAVIQRCRSSRAQEGTWITPALIEGYHSLFCLGYAHSIEAYADNQLVGGLYGVSIGSVFFGESMFFSYPDASKICLVSLVAHLKLWGFSLIDCQAHTDHLARFGAGFMARDAFLRHIKQSQHTPTRLGPWHCVLDLEQALALCS